MQCAFINISKDADINEGASTRTFWRGTKTYQQGTSPIPLETWNLVEK